MLRDNTSLMSVNFFLVPPPSPTLLSNATDKEHATIAWEVPDADQKQMIDHFIIQLDNNPESFIKNNFTTVALGESSSDHMIAVKAVNECGQKGNALMVPFWPSSSTGSGIEETPKDASGVTTSDLQEPSSAQELLGQGMVIKDNTSRSI